MFSPVISMLAERAKDVSSLLQSDVHTYINILHFFAKHTILAEVIAYLFCGNLRLNLYSILSEVCIFAIVILSSSIHIQILQTNLLHLLQQLVERI